MKSRLEKHLDYSGYIVDGFDLKLRKEEIDKIIKSMKDEAACNDSDYDYDDSSASESGGSGNEAGPSTRAAKRKFTQEDVDKMILDAEKRGKKDGENSMKRKIQEHAECGICLKLPKSGIQLKQCPNGHLICEGCFDNCGQFCPTCRSPLRPAVVYGQASYKIRALAIEQLMDAVDLERECKHLSCNVIAQKETLTLHENTCEHRLVPCPEFECKQKVPFSGVINHIKESHPRTKFTEKELPYFCNYFLHQSKYNSQDFDHSWRLSVIEYRGKQFFPVFVAIKGVYYAWVYILGGSEEAAQFKAFMAVGKALSSVIAHLGKVFPIDTEPEEIFKQKEGILTFSHWGMGSTGSPNETPPGKGREIDLQLPCWLQLTLLG